MYRSSLSRRSRYRNGTDYGNRAIRKGNTNKRKGNAKRKRKKIKNVSTHNKKYKSKKNIKRKVNSKIINIPLAKDQHMGTAETLGDMNYYYQKYSNIAQFFYYIIDHYNVTKEYTLERLCMPSFGELNTGSYASLVYNVDHDYNINNPRPTSHNVLLNDAIYEINKCLENNDRFVVLSYQIISHQFNISHANTIIFDKKLQVVELFEPHGALTESTTMNGMLGAYIKIDANLNKFLSVYFPTYIYQSPKEYLPSYGLQVKIDAYNGLCVTWNMIYIHYKLMNPDVPSKILINHINKYIKLDELLRYAKYVKHMLYLSKKFKLKSTLEGTPGIPAF